MKNTFCLVLAITVLSTAVLSTDVYPKNDVEKQILEFLKKWRSGDTLPFYLPPLHLIRIPPLNGSYSGKGIKITYSASELMLVGMNNFSVVDLSVSLPAMRASGALNVPTIVVTSDNYELQGKAFYVYKLKGAGKLDITLYDVTLQFGIRLAGEGRGSRVVEMQLEFDINNIQANLENSSWPINKLLNNEGVKILNGHHEEIISATRARLVGRFDEYLAAVTPQELLNKIRDE